jgi:hypothetical protein
MICLNPKELYEFFESKNLKYFYHANTVITSCTYIEQKGLMARGCVEYKGLAQTPQTSDEIDKQFDVWNDIFLDLFDLHGYFPRQNLYGPVCFIIDNRFLLDNELPNIGITKTNPIYWKTFMSEKDKYYSTAQEYIDEFEENKRNKCIQQKMFTIHNTHKKLPLKKYLIKLLLDNPRVKIDDISLFKEAKQKLINSLESMGFDKHILESRNCTNCYCHQNYFNQIEIDELKRLFL